MTPTANDLSGFGQIKPIRPLAGGHRNSVWLVELSGKQHVAKSSRRTEDQLAWLEPIQAKARISGFIVPELLHAADGARVSNGWTLEPFVQGSNYSLSQMKTLRPRIDAFHATLRGIGQRPGFSSMHEFCSEDRGGDIDLSALPKPVVQQLRTAWAAMSGQPVQAIHGDLTPSNLIATPDGPALMDWDEARVDCLFLDQINFVRWTTQQTRAHQALEIASGWILEPVHARALWDNFILSA
ncbi:phosphotransferase [Thioclava sp. FR2]|uniref:phosphotransferase n=1 Tax=Thioclava sp. FR2 TaxID=3445780 RepID=UPI003EB762A5